MFALLRQLSKLLLLVFNLPKVLSLLSNLFKVSIRDGKLELGIVDTIAKSVVGTQTQRLIEDIEAGKEKEIEQVEQETEELKRLYSDLKPEAKEFFTNQAEARRTRRINDIQNTNPTDIVNDDLVNQMVRDKKEQLDPAITPALAPITALLGIPIFIQKLVEYVPQASGLASGIISKESADRRADAYTSEFDDGGGDVFNGVVSEGNLEISFNGIDDGIDFKLFPTPRESDRVVLSVTDTDSKAPYSAQIQNYGALKGTNSEREERFTINIVSNKIEIIAKKTPDVGQVLHEILKSTFGYDTETEIVVLIVDANGQFGTVRIPTELSLDANAR